MGVEKPGFISWSSLFQESCKRRKDLEDVIKAAPGAVERVPTD